MRTLCVNVSPSAVSGMILAKLEGVDSDLIVII